VDAWGRTLNVVLTHFHLDHVVGLAYLPALPLPLPPRVYGPGKWLYRRSTKDILGMLIGPPFAIKLETVTSEVGEIDEVGLELGSFEIATRIQRHHSDPTLALRVDGLVTYCTDTSYDAGNIAFAEGSRVLIH
jgi:ribonuclease BN (tRNA processing enzyme)